MQRSGRTVWLPGGGELCQLWWKGSVCILYLKGRGVLGKRDFSKLREMPLALSLPREAAGHTNTSPAQLQEPLCSRVS